MPTFLLPQPVPVEGLGFATSDATWAGDPVPVRQRAEAIAAGLAFGPSSDVITISAGAIASGPAIAAFVRVSHAVEGDVIGILGEPMAAWCDDPALGSPARLIRLRGGGSFDAARLAAAKTVTIPVEGASTLDVRLADVPGGRTVALPTAPAVLCAVDGWAGLLWANLLSLGPVLKAEIPRPAWSLPFRAARALWTGGTGEAFLARMSRVDAGAFVHPDASITASWIRAGARIGPGAVVAYSIVGEGASVEAQGLVQFCVLGAKAHVQRKGFAQYAVVHTDGAVAGTLQLAVVGPGAAIKRGAVLFDQTLDGEAVRVYRHGDLHPVPLGSIGVGVGARSVLGSGVQVAPGRTVPPDLHVIADASAILRRIPEGSTGLVEVKDGTLVAR